ncbi:MAG: signal peptidase I [Euryarchaeota archaeon]|nr:signal peptidase I [Euryarchaeota archaeon]
MDFMQKMLVFYFLVILVIVYFISGVRIPLTRLLLRFGPMRERLERSIRERKVATRMRQMVFPYRPKTLSEILLISILYLFLGYLILSKFFFFAVVVSDSMRPTFEKGDLVLIQTLSREPEVGDIILFSGFIELDQERREFVIHRVYAITGDGMVKTRGDAMTAPDPWEVPPEKIVGKAVTLFGHPVVIKKVGESLILEPGKAITNPLVIQYIIGTARKMGMVIFLLVILMYVLLEFREYRVRKALR